MINAHCEQSYKVWAEDEKKLYNFRILELSGKFVSLTRCIIIYTLDSMTKEAS